MNVRPPNSRRNLDLAIERVFGDREGALRVRRTMANVIVGQMLPEGVVKGGSALKIRFGLRTTRFSQDLDAARVGDIDAFVDALEERLSVGWGGFTGHVIPKAPAHPKDVPTQYVMQPFQVKLEYKYKPWLTVPLEIGHDEIGDADQPDWVIASDAVEVFRLLGLPDPGPIPCMPLEHQMAQKLHALSTPESDRAHDLVDLQVIMQNGQVDLTRTREVCRRLFAYRNQQNWPPVIEGGESWDGLYDAARDGLDVVPSVVEAVEWVNKLISIIDRSDGE